MVADTSTAPFKRRLRSRALPVSKCRRPAFLRTNFPDPVRRNRFLAPLCVFIFTFMVVSSLPCVRGAHYLGAKIMIRLRPSILGANSTVPASVHSLMTLVMIVRPIS